MRIKLKTAWQHFPKGHEFDVGTVGGMPAAQAQMLTVTGAAEYVQGQILRSPVRGAMKAGRDYVTRGAKAKG